MVVPAGCNTQFPIQVCFWPRLVIPAVAEIISSHDYEPMILTFELDPDIVEMNQHTKQPGQRSFSSKLLLGKAFSHAEICTSHPSR